MVNKRERAKRDRKVKKELELSRMLERERLYFITTHKKESE